MVRERLYRSRSDRILFGVAGGMAEWLGMDPAIVRLVWAILIVFGGAGLLLYLIAIFVIPEEPLGRLPEDLEDDVPPTDPAAAETWRAEREQRRAARAARRAERRGDGRGAIVFGAFLIALGAWFLLQQLIPGLDGRFVGPAILIGLGAVLVVTSMGRREG